MDVRLASEPLIQDSIVDGPGLRNVLWTQGCGHNCAGCHNPQTQDMEGGSLYDCDHIIETLVSLKKETGTNKITLSGGEMFLQPLALTHIASSLKAQGFNIWAYTGFTFEEILLTPELVECLKYIDVLVDGPYMAHLRDLTLPFRGSSNQRVIAVEASLKIGHVLVLEQYNSSDTLSNSY